MAKKRKKSGALTLILVCSALVLALAVCGVILLQRANRLKAERLADLNTRALAMIPLSAAETDIPPAETEFVGEYDGKTVSDKTTNDAAVSLALESFSLPLVFETEPESCTVDVTRGGASLFSGDLAYYNDFTVPENGEYTYEVSARFDDGAGVTADCLYRFNAVFDVQTKVYLTETTVPQGGATMLVAENLRDPASLAVTVEYPYEPQVERTATGGAAYLPINYMRGAGVYKVFASYDGKEETFEFNVTETEYEVQHLTVSASTVSNTVGSNTAAEEIAEKFYSLDSHFDENIYWTENFIQPVDGSITTEYGIKRYTNNATTPSRHAGIDIANAEGTPIMASNSGVVLFADYLQMTGYTIMIEHGMGVHTVYYHMSGLNCEKGDIVERGDEIGYVGATGFATGPHLHFAVMVNTVSISPWYVFDGTSGIYAIKDIVKEQ